MWPSDRSGGMPAQVIMLWCTGLYRTLKLYNAVQRLLGEIFSSTIWFISLVLVKRINFSQIFEDSNIISSGSPMGMPISFSQVDKDS